MRGTDVSRTFRVLSLLVAIGGTGLLAGSAARAQGQTCSPPSDWPGPLGRFLLCDQQDVDLGPLALGTVPKGSPAKSVVERLVSLQAPNYKPAAVLSQLDVDGDGLPDGSPDSDGDGLPDNWEINGVEPPSGLGVAGLDRLVRFSAPTAIGPGTPPTFIFSRLTVATNAYSADTDADGLSDFIEVFGLKYIDDNGNGKLDFFWTDKNGNGKPDPGEEVPGSEWFDANLDGLPSIGEYPLPNLFADLDTNGDGVVDQQVYLLDTNGDGVVDAYDTNGDGLKEGDYEPRSGKVIWTVGSTATVINERLYDFDGFVFTDPTNADTDGDGVLDGADPDPLINPQTFGIANAQGFQRPETQGQECPPACDLDKDGFGNGSDFGNDITKVVDFPTDIADLIKLFRPDRLALSPPTIPESLIEDLIGADWDGNGLYRITDVRNFSNVVTETTLQAHFGSDRFKQLFIVNGHELFSSIEGAVTDPRTMTYGARGAGLPLQELLLPAGRSQPFIPDERVWTILYAWRVPGFDIDGNGFTGSPDKSFAVDQAHPFTGGSTRSGTFQLDGRIDVPSCGNIGGASAATMLCGLGIMVVVPRWRRHRR